MKKLLLLAIVVLGISGASFAQETATATSTATIVTPIAITKTGDMNFGNVSVQSTTAGTVILAPAGTRTTGGAGGVTLPAVTGTVSAAHFDIEGAANYTYTITLPSAPLTVSSGGNSMTVTNFTSNPSTTGTLDGDGEQTINVGATLNVAGGQAAGTYTSATPFSVTVNYN